MAWGEDHHRAVQVMEDLEDYFHRLDARRSEMEAELAGTENDDMAADNGGHICEKSGLCDLHMPIQGPKVNAISGKIQ